MELRLPIAVGNKLVSMNSFYDSVSLYGGKCIMIKLSDSLTQTQYPRAIDL